MAGEEKKVKEDNRGTSQPPAAAGMTAEVTNDGEDSPVDDYLLGGARGSDSERRRAVLVQREDQTAPDPAPATGQQQGDVRRKIQQGSDADAAAVNVKRRKLNQPGQPSPSPQATTAALQEMFPSEQPTTMSALQEEHRLSQALTAFLQENLPRLDQPSSPVRPAPVPAGQPTAAAPRTLELLDPKPPVPIFTPPKCWACNNRPASMVSRPTMHLCVCEDCFDARSTACPLCRGDGTPRG